MPDAVSNILVDATPRLRFGTVPVAIGDGTAALPVQVPGRLYGYNGVRDLSLTRLMLVFSMKMGLLYEDTLRLHLEDLARSTALIETAALVAERLAAVHHEDPLIDMFQTVPFRRPDGSAVQVRMYDYLTEPRYLGIAGLCDPTLGGDTHWNFSECKDGLAKLNHRLDELNSVNEEQNLDVQSALNSLNLAYKYGMNMTKQMLHGARNLANNLTRV